MRTTLAVFQREFGAYFASPLAAIFIVIFLVLVGAFTFFLGGFFERGQADLQTFFSFHPWLYLVLVPALGMRLWAEERKAGTIELLMTLPVRTWELVLGKFLAGWAFAGLVLALTFPMWLTVNHLGRPDNGVILASYIGSWLMAGVLLSLAACLSALTKNQVIAFILAAAGGFVLMLAGIDVVLGFLRPWASTAVVDFVATLSVLTHFQQITRGVIEATTLVFYLGLIATCLFANTALIEREKAK
ncbi:MAG: ABC transporter permease [Rhodospirillales bacterium]|jgi:ABC-2 type transport system permease protein